MSTNKVLGIGLVVIVLASATWWSLSHHEDQGTHDHDHATHEDIELTAKEPVRADGTFSIVTSVYPLEFALTRISGDLAAVTNIGTGRDPHDFRPSTQDIITLQQADLVVLQGAELEPWGDDISLQLAKAGVPVVVATAELDLRETTDHHDDRQEMEADMHDDHEHEVHEHDHGAYDPHTWLDPVLYSETVEHLAESIAALDPDNAAVYAANTALLQSELADLDRAYQTSLANCTVDEVITSHEAFGYLAERYDIDIHSIAGISTQDLPSAQTLAELKTEAAEDINAILLEANSVTAFGETLAAETGLMTLPINTIEFNTADDEDYLTLMHANLETFKTALACHD